jgi:hypothetical protein
VRGHSSRGHWIVGHPVRRHQRLGFGDNDDERRPRHGGESTTYSAAENAGRGVRPYAAAVTAVTVEWLKWPAQPYRVTPMTRLGSDEQGTWMFAPRGAPASYATLGATPLPVNFLTLLPSGGQCWMCTWMWGNPSVDIELYVDIVHPPAWTSDERLEVIDLDLDIIRYRDGRVVVDDEDEFAQHTSSLCYPASVVTSARQTATAVFSAVTERTPPFQSPPDRWTRAAAQLAADP